MKAFKAENHSWSCTEGDKGKMNTIWRDIEPFNEILNKDFQHLPAFTFDAPRRIDKECNVCGFVAFCIWEKKGFNSSIC